MSKRKSKPAPAPAAATATVPAAATQQQQQPRLQAALKVAKTVFLAALEIAWRIVGEVYCAPLRVRVIPRLRKEFESLLSDLNQAEAERDALRAERDALRAERDALKAAITAARKALK